jgi:hypothetical protein
MIVGEAILVGAYTCAIYELLRVFVKGAPLWFILGVCKHGFAGVLGLHDFYCKLKGYSGIDPSLTSLALESLGEGGMFLVAKTFLPDTVLSAFFLGVALHLAFEIGGGHSYFLQTKCLI